MNLLRNIFTYSVESDKSQFAADWDLQEMIMWKIIPPDDHKQALVYFPFNRWLGKKVGTLTAKRDKYSPPEHHPRGKVLFTSNSLVTILVIIHRSYMLPCCSENW